MNLSEAAQAVGVTRQRIHQIAVKKGIGTHTPSKRSGQCRRWEFSQEDVQRMVAERGKPKREQAMDAQLDPTAPTAPAVVRRAYAAYNATVKAEVDAQVARQIAWDAYHRIYHEWRATEYAKEKRDRADVGYSQSQS